ncbi:hypothetical protein HYDPIDRAFT_44684, partial [Hydnomerulius pinastri MD-312]
MPTIYGKVVPWLPERKVVLEFHRQHLNSVLKRGLFSVELGVKTTQLSLVILELKQLIEDDPLVFRDINEMFTQVNEQGETTCLENYQALLACLEEVINEAPAFSGSSSAASSVPMYAILGPFLNT